MRSIRQTLPTAHGRSPRGRSRDAVAGLAFFAAVVGFIMIPAIPFLALMWLMRPTVLSNVGAPALPVTIARRVKPGKAELSEPEELSELAAIVNLARNYARPYPL